MCINRLMARLMVMSTLGAMVVMPASFAQTPSGKTPVYAGAATGTHGGTTSNPQDRVVDAQDIATRLGDSRSITLESKLALPAVQFELGTAMLTARARQQLDQVAIALGGEPIQSIRVFIDGHTDASGSASFNRRLSLQRSQSAVAYLVERGIPADRLEARGFGEAQLLASEADPESPLHRRVEITRRH